MTWTIVKKGDIAVAPIYNTPYRISVYVYDIVEEVAQVMDGDEKTGYWVEDLILYEEYLSA